MWPHGEQEERREGRRALESAAQGGSLEGVAVRDSRSPGPWASRRAAGAGVKGPSPKSWVPRKPQCWLQVQPHLRPAQGSPTSLSQRSLPSRHPPRRHHGLHVHLAQPLQPAWGGGGLLLRGPATWVQLRATPASGPRSPSQGPAAEASAWVGTAPRPLPPPSHSLGRPCGTPGSGLAPCGTATYLRLLVP